ARRSNRIECASFATVAALRIVDAEDQPRILDSRKYAPAISIESFSNRTNLPGTTIYELACDRTSIHPAINRKSAEITDIARRERRESQARLVILEPICLAR